MLKILPPYNLVHIFRFFVRVDRVLRRSLGVSETARADESVKPAPPVDEKSLDDLETEKTKVSLEDYLQQKENQGGPKIDIPDEWKDQLSIELEDVYDEPQYKRDEL